MLEAWSCVARSIDFKWSCWMAFELLYCTEAKVLPWRLLDWLPSCSFCSKTCSAILLLNRSDLSIWYVLFLLPLYEIVKFCWIPLWKISWCFLLSGWCFIHPLRKTSWLFLLRVPWGDCHTLILVLVDLNFFVFLILAMLYQHFTKKAYVNGCF